ncbi:hypothetical protein BCIN_04g05310 [Botrytis cinerea B05.10]|uniref:SAP domain-containing protein n=1 Tax=Botryotinia fuckeliana (strain B05.10) TaxID=332648 RepID=A0A384JFI5_BOTFB|nr:hypothetical protein BCIN_04g05310 [Botrytis cinerea B05.10]ATZ49373.1 hypothetical protein BCIN_04g05310 [Botrytis cinerea B05.10]
MATTIPSTLKAAALKQIAFKCGISTSGTKPLLIQRLQDELPQINSANTKGSSTDAKPLRILSIDMGIRNFSFCLLEIPPSKSTSRSRSSKKSKEPTIPIPILQSWQKLSLLPQSPPNVDPETKEKTRNEFTPSILSTAAYSLIRHTLLPLSPTHVLIERQRFRSMGSKHILEWTIRVNMLESMLWATLKTLAEEKVWDGEVIEIAPRKVGVFWVEERGLLDEEGDKFKKVRNTKEVKARTKGAKIDLVRGWLEAGENQNGESQNRLEMVQIGSQQVREVKERYTAKWDRKAGRAKGFKVKSKTRNNEDKEEEEEEEEEMIPEKEEGVGKLDDLADCLLQGMAWLKWQENKKRVLEEGVEVLLEC